MIEKNKEYIVNIIDNGFEGEGIAKIDNFTVFIPNGIKGEKVKILIVKVNKNFAYGKVLEIIEKSQSRNELIDCKTYKRCGGCNLRHIKYEDTLLLKKDIVMNSFKKALNKDIKINSVIGMENPVNYRNKLQFPVGSVNNEIVIGVYANRTHEIIPVDFCYIQDQKSQIIVKDIFKFLKENNIEPYNEKTRKGIVRHIVIKNGKKTDEIMVIIVVNDNFKKEKEFVQYLIKKHKITTIVKNINKDNTNVILGKENIVLYGEGYITDILGEYKFKISPLAFYQTNSIQTEKLYNKAIEFADLKETDIVCDLYCGIGTITIFISKYVKKVYGIEVVEDAINDAKDNAKLNNIQNIEFFAGDVEKILPVLLKKVKPDIIFVDPPRRGLDNNTINNLLRIKPKKIVYISCNHSTLARDIKLLEEIYDIKEVQPVDMFPYTSNIECCAVLKLK